VPMHLQLPRMVPASPLGVVPHHPLRPIL
jgi:hypothetical protein